VKAALIEYVPGVNLLRSGVANPFASTVCDCGAEATPVLTFVNVNATWPVGVPELEVIFTLSGLVTRCVLPSMVPVQVKVDGIV
jgi:hypothetical protein